MSQIYKDITETIGHTPLVKLRHFPWDIKSGTTILAKLEYFNPLASVKDRIGYAMLKQAEKEGKINKHSTIIEPTSGNTGISLAFICANKGYSCILTMPDSMSAERRSLLRALGAQLYLTPAEMGMRGAIEKAQEIAEKKANSFIPMQFDNPANPNVHYQTTAVEIWNDTNGIIDFFIAGVGTGGTLTGVGTFLKERKPDTKIIAVEPAESAVLSGQSAGPHKIMGIGAGFIPKVLDLGLIDEIITVDDQKAMQLSREMARREGILCGISSGAALEAANVIACRSENKDKTIVVLLPSSGERYLSTELFKKYNY